MAELLHRLRRLRALDRAPGRPGGRGPLPEPQRGDPRAPTTWPTTFGDALAATQEYHQRIVAEAKAGKPARQIAEDLGAEIYAKTPFLPLDFFQKNCGLLGQIVAEARGNRSRR